MRWGKGGRANKNAKLVVMPSSNPLLGKEITGSEGMGPVFKNKLFKWNGAIVYTLSGTKLGKLSEFANGL